MAVTSGTGGYPTPQVMIDGTPAVNPLVQKAKRDQLASINARLSRKLATLRDGVAVLAERIKDRE